MSARKHSTRIASALIILALLTAAGVYGFSQFNKTQLQNQLLELASALELELTLAGTTQLDLVRQEFILRDLRLSHPQHPQELASVRELSLRLSPWQLGQSSWQISQLTLDGLHINQRSAADGGSIWLTDTLRGLLFANAGEALDLTPQLAIERLLISESSLDVSTQAASFALRDIELELLGANLLGEPFELQGQGVVARYSGLHRDEMRVPLTFGGEVVAELASASASVNSLRLGSTPLLAEIAAQATWLGGELAVGGSVSALDFDLNAWMRSLEPETLQNAFGEQFEVKPQTAAFEFDFNLNSEGLIVQDFDARIGEGAIDAQLVFSAADERLPANRRYAIRGSEIDFSFLDPQRAGFWAQLPQQLMLGTQLDTVAAIDIELLRWSDSDLTQLQLFVNAERGVTEFELLPLGLWGGQVAGALRVDSRSEQDTFALEANIASLNSERMAQSLPLLASFGGELSADLDLQGALVNSELVADSLRGEITFDVRNNRVPMDLLKQVFSTIAALSPVGGSTEQWPDTLSFSQLSGFALLDSGLTQPHRVNLLMDNLEIEGSGVFDPASEEFDYALSFTLLPDARNKPLEINDAHVAKPWPVNCAANLNAPITQYCSPDFSGVRRLFAAPDEETLSPVDAILNAVPRQ